ncbi:acyl carrier protein [Streptomyces sp. NPDC006976]|uniref:acyl carrier protein n=1 Tax=unclassified Streptomyces TaxID=2593676 RepID=UPI00036386C1|nr:MULTISPECIES: acyl carrier protein [unclassified Streptomyces]MYY05682.1 acyl carrier protein [Streptomyces sp. SID4913]
MSTIHPRITDVLSRTFKVPVAEILPESTMDSLDMDSLAVAEFAVVLRETTGVELDSATLHRQTTLAALTEFLRASADGGAPVSNAR